jgi:hypothetical protein
LTRYYSRHVPVHGTAIAPRRNVKLEVTEAKLTEMKIRLKKIMESSLLIVQKIDAMKTFVLPMFARWYRPQNLKFLSILRASDESDKADIANSSANNLSS